MPLATRRLGRTEILVSRLGLGLAAVGRPGYITLGRADDLPAVRSEAALDERTGALLEAAVAAGVRYVDVARSYGQAEAFLARWLDAHPTAGPTLAVGSKWGYRYTADWRVDAPVHEQKELSLARFREQLAQSRALLGDRLALYQIHSATADSGALEDAALLAALVDARRSGACRALGLTLTGSDARRALDLALAASVDGERVFDVVQATYNVLEPSLASHLAAAHAAGFGVIIKEAHANGRLTGANRRPEDRRLRARLDQLSRDAGLPLDRLALAFVAAEPWVDVVLSGAATVAQLHSHVAALDATIAPAVRDALSELAEPSEPYWRTRAALPWA